MPRIRTIKPEFWSSPGIGDLEYKWRLLFISMWNWADDFGRGTCNPRELLGFTFPEDEEITVGELRRGLGELRRQYGVMFYKFSGRVYYSIPSWELHQKMDKRVKGSRYPSPDESLPFDPVKWQVIDESENPADNTAEYADNTVDPSETHPLEQGNRGTGEQGNRPPSPDSGGAGGGATKGTRLPDGWEPSQSTVEKIQSEYPHLDIAREHEIFTDYWRGVSGAKAVKRDWNATWRNWMRRAKQSTPAKQVSFLDQVRANRTADTIDGEVIESKELPF